MRLSIVLVTLAYLVSALVFASEGGQPPASNSPTPPTSAQPKAAQEVRQSADSDLIVKEWHSPITFDIDASWLETLPINGTATIRDLPSFYCDGATVGAMTITKTRPRNGWVRLKFAFDLYVKGGAHDKFVDMEFTLMGGDSTFPLGRVEDFQVAEGRTLSTWAWYEIAGARIAPYVGAEAPPKIRVSMIVRND